MQISNEDDLAKRIRYYQGLLDLNNLKRGSRYENLCESYIVFICLFDYFKRGKHVYTFRERCDEDFNLLLGDGTTKVFLNTEGILNDADEDIKNFLEYVARGVIADDFIKELDAAVREIRSAKKVRLDYVTLELMLRHRIEKAAKQAHEEGRREGRQEGRQEGRREGRREGRQEGLQEGKLSMVENLLQVKTPIEYIEAATGWSKEKILQLAEKLK